MLQKGEVDKLEVLASRDTVLVTLHQGAVINGKKEPYTTGHSYYFTINNPDTLERLITLHCSNHIKSGYIRANGYMQ